MKRTNIVFLSVIAVVAGAGCSSDSSSCADGGDASCSSSSTDSAAETVADGPVLYGLTVDKTTGNGCYVVTAVAPGTVDGCDKGTAVTQADLMMLTLPLNYAGGIVQLGNSGSLGGGQILNNKGTLVRANDPTLDGAPACMWHQMDTSQFELTANDTFTVSVVEVQSTFTNACATSFPVIDPCTSSWKWTMGRSTKLPPSCL